MIDRTISSIDEPLIDRGSWLMGQHLKITRCHYSFEKPLVRVDRKGAKHLVLRMDFLKT